MKKKLFLLSAIVVSLFMARHLLSFSEESAFAKLVDANVAAIAQAQRMDGSPVVITCSQGKYGRCYRLENMNKEYWFSAAVYACKWTGKANDNCEKKDESVANIHFLMDFMSR